MIHALQRLEKMQKKLWKSEAKSPKNDEKKADKMWGQKRTMKKKIKWFG